MCPRENGLLLEAPWILRKEERKVVKRTIEMIHTPTRTMHSLKDAFTSMIEKELSGFKSHNWHKMLQVDFLQKKLYLKFLHAILDTYEVVVVQFILPIVIARVGKIEVRRCIYNLSSLVRYIFKSS